LIKTLIEIHIVLKVAEEKAQQREEEYKKQIKVLTDRLKNAESRYIFDIFWQV